MCFCHDIPIRVGVNAGFLKKNYKKNTRTNSDALVESAINHVNILKKQNFENFKLGIKLLIFYDDRKLQKN